jgi:hypothetical protein
MKAIFGGFLEYISDEKLLAYTETMDNQMAINMIEAAFQYGVKSGLYNLEEAHCLYKCLLQMKNLEISHGSGFKGPSRVATVELDEKE